MVLTSDASININMNIRSYCAKEEGLDIIVTLNTKVIDIKTCHSSYAYAYYMSSPSLLAHAHKLVMHA